MGTCVVYLGRIYNVGLDRDVAQVGKQQDKEEGKGEQHSDDSVIQRDIPARRQAPTIGEGATFR